MGQLLDAGMNHREVLQLIQVWFNEEAGLFIKETPAPLWFSNGIKNPAFRKENVQYSVGALEYRDAESWASEDGGAAPFASYKSDELTMKFWGQPVVRYGCFEGVPFTAPYCRK